MESEPIICRHCWAKKANHYGPCEHVTTLLAERDRLQAQVESLTRRLAARRVIAERVPDGYEEIEAWTNGTEVIVMGRPVEDDDDHNCDALGCGAFGPHVLWRGNVRQAATTPTPPGDEQHGNP